MASIRRLAAILAADLLGYSRLMDEDEEGTLRRLKRVQAEVLDPRFVQCGGRLVKTTGDGFLVEFSSVIEALRCASAIQDDMADQGDIAPSRRLMFRIGIHQGDIVVEDDDIFGNGVNIAARLEGLAEPGGICISARVQEDAFGRIDLVFEDIGDQQLKNIARPVRVFRVHAPKKEQQPGAEQPDLAAADPVAEEPAELQSAEADVAPASDAALAVLATARLGYPVELSRTAGGWRRLEPESRTALPVGGRNPGTRNQLGVDATLGLRAWESRPRVVLRLGPVDRAAFSDLAPGRRGMQGVVSLMRGYLGAECEIVVKPVLASAERTPPRLNSEAAPRLGWDSWLASSGGASPDDGAEFLAADISAAAAELRPETARLTPAK